MNMLMLDAPPSLPRSLSTSTSRIVGSARVISAAGATLLAAPESAPAQAELALNLLRGFRAAGRRLAWFDTTELAASPGSSLAEWGERIVEWGDARWLIVTGPQARLAALAARDAGLPLSRVIVCTCTATAANLLADVVAPGDVALLLGVSEECIENMTERLQSQFACG